MTKHGKNSTYTGLGCRCDPCRLAHNAAVKAFRNRDKPIPDHVHGSINGYNNYRCRCDSCAQAKDEYMKVYRDKE